jgi:predicted RNase H-like HicB family nuclease
MKTTALIEMGKDGTYSVYTSEIDSAIIGTGDTVVEAKADFENSVREIFQSQHVLRKLQGEN